MTYRAVIAGCGAMSRGWLEAIVDMADITLVGLVDIDVERARQLAESFQLSHVALDTDLERMLAQTSPDLLFDITPPTVRHQVVALGLTHGCHVLSEKPMAATLDEARELIALSKRTDRIHAVVQNRRFVAGVRRIKRFIDSGALGALTALHGDFFMGPHFGGFRDQMEHALLLDMAIHTFDAARLMAGQEPVAVYCHETNPKGSWFAHGAAANAIFEMTEGVVFTYCGSWCADGLRTSWESQWRIAGERGTLFWDGGNAFRCEVRDDEMGRDGLFAEVASQPVPPLSPDDAVGGHAGVLHNFVESIAAGHAPETVNSDNIQSLAMVLAAIESARTRQRIEFNEQS